MDVVSLTRKLISFNTVNPPGNEGEIARFTGNLLADHGFKVEYQVYSGSRLHMIAEKGIVPGKAPLILSGHFDTVPPGNISWNVDPFAGDVHEGKIWGRGSSDMKGGLAAMATAAIEAFNEKPPSCGVKLIFTADEEPGCPGILQLVSISKEPPEASAIIIGEPTSNLPATGHKGAIYLKARFKGKTAHSSMPEKGINAIYKAARAVVKISEFKFEAERDQLLGYPTINVGKIAGGQNLNSVADHAEFTVDIRTTTKVDHSEILKKLSSKILIDAVIEKMTDLQPVFTSEEDPFVRLVYSICGVEEHDKRFPLALPYLTEGAVLQKFFGGIPIVILGPGEPETAHTANEFCYIDRLTESVRIYKEIILQWQQ
ncbi:MAG TPA: M20 family metallopeptidase [Bacteroidales bacterium]|nr:M20 family metallopeptidase [Bacteroidales bacterium]HPM88250.1 M20 family metallopeptidase [Bacteroidales bacterium]